MKKTTYILIIFTIFLIILFLWGELENLSFKQKINDDGIDDVLVVDWQLAGCTYLFNVLVGLVSFIGLGVSFIGGFAGLGFPFGAGR